MTPTQRSLKIMRDRGFLVAVVERWNPHARIRVDLFGFADLLVVGCGSKPLFIQTTSGSNVAARKAKILSNQNAVAMLRCGWANIDIHGWRKVGPRGKRKVWRCREVEVTLEDMK